MSMSSGPTPAFGHRIRALYSPATCEIGSFCHG